MFSWVSSVVAHENVKTVTTHDEGYVPYSSEISDIRSYIRGPILSGGVGDMPKPTGIIHDG